MDLQFIVFASVILALFMILGSLNYIKYHIAKKKFNRPLTNEEKKSLVLGQIEPRYLTGFGRELRNESDAYFQSLLITYQIEVLNLGQVEKKEEINKSLEIIKKIENQAFEIGINIKELSKQHLAF